DGIRDDLVTGVQTCALPISGVIATDQHGHQGVTSADHAFKPSARKVTVADVPGTICSRHAVSDSCFIELPKLPGPIGQEVRGPRSEERRVGKVAQERRETAK